MRGSINITLIPNLIINRGNMRGELSGSIGGLFIPGEILHGPHWVEDSLAPQTCSGRLRGEISYRFHESLDG